MVAARSGSIFQTAQSPGGQSGPGWLILTESQLKALEKAKEEKQPHGEIETLFPGYLGSQDTYFVGTIKGVGCIYQQTFVDTYSKVAFAKVYDRKSALVAADLLNDRVLPFFDAHAVKLLRVLTDRGTDGAARRYCGKADHHEYQLYLALEDIDHTKTKVRSPQQNGICERFHKTIQDEFYAIAFRKKVYQNLEQIQTDLDEWLEDYNRERTHQGKYCFGKTPYQTFMDSAKLAWEKDLSDNKLFTQQTVR